jgi:hypothetical protein
MVQQLE